MQSFNRLYITLFSAFGLTHWAVLPRDWFWMSDCNLSAARVEYPPKWYTHSAVWLLHGWYHVKVVPSRCTFCVYHTTMYAFSVTKIIITTTATYTISNNDYEKLVRHDSYADKMTSVFFRDNQSRCKVCGQRKYRPLHIHSSQNVKQLYTGVRLWTA